MELKWAAKTNSNDTCKRIIECIRQRSPMGVTPSEIGEACYTSPTNVLRYLRLLLDQGTIAKRKHARGLYILANEDTADLPLLVSECHSEILRLRRERTKVKLTLEQLKRLLEIAEENTMECYLEHCRNYGQPDEQRACNIAETEVYQSDLSFIVEIKEQEGIEI